MLKNYIPKVSVLVKEDKELNENIEIDFYTYSWSRLVIYKDTPIEKKKEILDKIKGDVLDKYLRKYKYKKPKTPTPE
jgi:hypothetical protein